MRVSTMCQRAEWPRRSPLRLSRWRWFLPLLASSGDAPHRCANAASLRSRPGLSPAANQERRGGVGPDAQGGDELGCAFFDQGFEDGVDLGDLLFERDGVSC